MMSAMVISTQMVEDDFAGGDDDRRLEFRRWLKQHDARLEAENTVRVLKGLAVAVKLLSPSIARDFYLRARKIERGLK